MNGSSLNLVYHSMYASMVFILEHRGTSQKMSCFSSFYSDILV